MLARRTIERALDDLYICHKNTTQHITARTVRTMRKLVEEHTQLKALSQEIINECREEQEQEVQTRSWIENKHKQ